MRTCNPIRRWLALVALAALSLQTSSFAQSYNIVDLGTLGGTESEAYAINISGQAVGWSYTASGVPDAFLYSGGAMTDLGAGMAFGINNSGQVVGELDLASGARHAFLYSGGVMKDLGTLGGSSSRACGINNSGQIVGYSYTAGNSRYHAFLYSGGVMRDLGTLPGGSYSEGFGINDSGQTVGWSYTSGNGTYHPFLFSGATKTDLGTLGGGYASALNINNSGQIVGLSAQHAFLYSGGAMTDLGPGWGEGINNSGQVVGLGSSDGFLYSGGTMSDLTSLVPADSGWWPSAPYAINDNGQIAGSGVNPAGQIDAFLMTLIPEPGSLALLALGGAALLLRRHGTQGREPGVGKF